MIEFDLGIYLLALSVGLSLIHYRFLSEIDRSGELGGREEGEVPVSIIIASKNEEINLARHLPEIFSQVYGEFEVIVIDDGSSDESILILENLARSHKNLHYASLDKGSGKKAAITKGVELAKNEWLLFTDADCAPTSDQWISEVVSQITPGTNMILGYSPFRRTGSFINALARTDAFIIAVQYLAFALIGKPYMGVGRNMAYRKTLFMSTGGFENHRNVLSGDDDLFVQEAAVGEKVAVTMGLNSQTISDSRATFFEWFSQKRRHTSTGFYYNLSFFFILGAIQINSVGFYILLVYNIWNGYFIWATMILVLIRFYSQYSVLKKSARKLGEIDLLLLSLILELPLIFLNLTAALSNILFKNSRWS